MRLLKLNVSNWIPRVFWVPIFTLLILSPYIVKPFSFVAGQLALVALLATLYFPILLSSRYKISINWSLIFLVAFLVCYPSSVSFYLFHTVDMQILKLTISIVLLIAFGVGLGFWFENSQLLSSLPIFLTKSYFYILWMHSILIILEFYNPFIRDVIESFLAVDQTVDYLDGVRYRGIASAGGANLAFAHGVAGVLGYYLYLKKLCSLPVFLLSGATILISLIFIGRTGIVVFFIGLLIVFLSTSSSRKSLNFNAYLGYLGGFLIVMILANTAYYFYDNLPRFYQSYSIDLFLGGTERFMDEGTLSTLYSFYYFPDDYLALLFGTGNFSGGFLFAYDGPSDPGIMKIFTAYGMPFGLMLYGLIFAWCFSNRSGNLGDLLKVLLLLIFIVEIKEPLLVKGYAARLFWILIGVSVFSRGIVKIKKFHGQLLYDRVRR